MKLKKERSGLNGYKCRYCKCVSKKGMKFVSSNSLRCIVATPLAQFCPPHVFWEVDLQVNTMMNGRLKQPLNKWYHIYDIGTSSHQDHPHLTYSHFQVSRLWPSKWPSRKCLCPQSPLGACKGVVHSSPPNFFLWGSQDEQNIQPLQLLEGSAIAQLLRQGPESLIHADVAIQASFFF